MLSRKPAVFFRVGGTHARKILRGREERKNTSGNSCQVFVSIWNVNCHAIELDPCMFYVCVAVPGEHSASKGNGPPHIPAEP